MVMGKGKKKNKAPSAFDKRLKNLKEELKKTKCNFLSDDLILPC